MFGVIGLFGLLRVSAGFESYGLLATIGILALSVLAFAIGVGVGAGSSPPPYLPAQEPHRFARRPRARVGGSPARPGAENSTPCARCDGSGFEWVELPSIGRPSPKRLSALRRLRSPLVRSMGLRQAAVQLGSGRSRKRWISRLPGTRTRCLLRATPGSMSA